MSSFDQETTDIDSFKNANQPSLCTPDGRDIEITVEELEEKASCTSRNNKRHEATPPQFTFEKTDDTDPFNDFSSAIRENVIPLTRCSPQRRREEKQDIQDITQMLDTLHKFAPCITFDFLQRMVTTKNEMFRENFLSLLERYGKHKENYGKKLIFFRTEGEGRPIALGIWENYDDETEKFGYVWNLVVPPEEAQAVQNKLNNSLSPLYNSLNFEIRKEENNQDFILYLSKKTYKYAIVLHSELPCGC